jgi:hypothetical protein
LEALLEAGWTEPARSPAGSHVADVTGTVAAAADVEQIASSSKTVAKCVVGGGAAALALASCLGATLYSMWSNRAAAAAASTLRCAA